MDSFEKKTNPLAEIEAMKAISEALAPLDEMAITRVLGWANSHFSGQAIVQKNEPRVKFESGNSIQSGTVKYGDLAELFDAAAPSTESDKALVVAYWFQFFRGESDLGGQQINSELKHLGHGLTNVTQALSALMARKPALVLQTKKSGTTKQARKTYKVTLEGKRAVEQMIQQQEAA